MQVMQAWGRGYYCKGLRGSIYEIVICIELAYVTIHFFQHGQCPTGFMDVEYCFTG